MSAVVADTIPFDRFRALLFGTVAEWLIYTIVAVTVVSGGTLLWQSRPYRSPSVVVHALLVGSHPKLALLLPLIWPAPPVAFWAATSALTATSHTLALWVLLRRPGTTDPAPGTIFAALAIIAICSACRLGAGALTASVSGWAFPLF
eukprot:TRINITY_DN3463_c0_g1_i3.p1 TRINITY_DN3463_c0_g1~~TRINITY_DN3463_c0_g1_i3.p1  ORF type:complete len:147 (-),score=17.73 TRINITY_DN3463_c0_g1_i3:24-464(-)